MRPRKRIGRILGKIERIWEKYPDFRLGQLLVSYGGFPSQHDPFGREDVDTEKCLDRALVELGIEKKKKCKDCGCTEPSELCMCPCHNSYEMFESPDPVWDGLVKKCGKKGKKKHV